MTKARTLATFDSQTVISDKTLVTVDTTADHILVQDATSSSLKKALLPAAASGGSSVYFGGSPSGNFTLAHGTESQLPLQTELADSGQGTNGVLFDSTITIPAGEAGVYFITAEIGALKNTSDIDALEVTIKLTDGTVLATQRISSVNGSRASVSAHYIGSLSVGNGIRLFAKAETAGDVSCFAEAGRSKISGFKVN